MLSNTQKIFFGTQRSSRSTYFNNSTSDAESFFQMLINRQSSMITAERWTQTAIYSRQVFATSIRTYSWSLKVLEGLWRRCQQEITVSIYTLANRKHIKLKDLEIIKIRQTHLWKFSSVASKWVKMSSAAATEPASFMAGSKLRISWFKLAKKLSWPSGSFLSISKNFSLGRHFHCCVLVTRTLSGSCSAGCMELCWFGRSRKLKLCIAMVTKTCLVSWKKNNKKNHP